jgi:hypothetical protein
VGDLPEFPKTAAEAASQAAGYLFQLRYGLYRALKRIIRDPTGSIAVERVDDIAGSSGQALIEIAQLKHTTNSATTFNDLSPAIWRTIGNWSRLVAAPNELNLATLELLFVTNAAVDKCSGISRLRSAENNRDPGFALTSLNAAAIKSDNQVTKKDRQDFLALESAVQAALVRAIQIIENSPNLDALGPEIEDLVHYACESASLTEFRAELEGWWFDRIAQAFSQGNGLVIPLVEVEARISYLREKYKIGALQIDVENPTENPDSLDSYLFARQVLSVKSTEQRLRNAQRDFLKASAQRSKWLREAKIDPIELDKYDQNLAERWTTQSAIIWNELAEGCSDNDKCKSGRKILGWAETQETPLRGASAQFLTSGSYHTLADRLRLGWHPDYKKLFGG